jgi:hypothetical protein
MAKAFRYTEKFGRELAELARSKYPPQRYHIIPSIFGSTWRILYEGGARALRIFKTKKEAIAYAKNSRNKSIIEVVVHDEDGMGRTKTLPLKKLKNAIS